MYMYCLLNDYVAPWLILPSCLFYISCQFQKQHCDQSRDDRDGVRGAGYKPIIKENARFEKYYQVRETGLYTCTRIIINTVSIQMYMCIQYVHVSVRSMGSPSPFNHCFSN